MTQSSLEREIRMIEKNGFYFNLKHLTCSLSSHSDPRQIHVNVFPWDDTAYARNYVLMLNVLTMCDVFWFVFFMYSF